MKNMDERIATLEDKLRQLKARQQRAEQKRKRAESKETKRAEQRRTFLAGTVVLEKVRRGEINSAEFRKWLDMGLAHQGDRELFKL